MFKYHYRSFNFLNNRESNIRIIAEFWGIGNGNEKGCVCLALKLMSIHLTSENISEGPEMIYRAEFDIIGLRPHPLPRLEA